MADLAIIALAGLLVPLLTVAVIAIRRPVRVIPTWRRHGTRTHAVAYEVKRGLEPVQAPGHVATPVAIDGPAADDSQYCQGCGRSTSPGAKFCRSCGALLEEIVPSSR